MRQWVDAPDAAQAITRYKVIQKKDSFSVVQAFPQTGRLHQIRVHLASLGTPLLGDPLYTGNGAHYRRLLKGTLSDSEREKELGFSRVALHAASLMFAHPLTGEPLCIKAPLTEGMQTLLSAVA